MALAYILAALHLHTSVSVGSIDWTAVSASATFRTLSGPAVGNCTCDLSKQGCDANCCCDSDCTAAEQALFTFCEPSRFGSSKLTYCSPDEGPLQVQRANYVKHYRTKTTAAMALFCVEIDNNPLSGKYFSVGPETLSKTQMDDLLGLSGGVKDLTGAEIDPAVQSDQVSYLVGQSIGMIYADVQSFPVPAAPPAPAQSPVPVPVPLPVPAPVQFPVPAPVPLPVPAPVRSPVPAPAPVRAPPAPVRAPSPTVPATPPVAPVPIMTLTVSATSFQFGDVLTVPGVGFGGLCSDYDQAGFMQTIPADPALGPRRCARAGTLQTLCASKTALDPSRYVGLYVSRRPMPMEFTKADTELFVAVQPTYWQTTVAGASNNGRADRSLLTFKQLNSTNVSLVFNASTGKCANAIIGVDYMIQYSGNGTIETVTPSVYLDTLATTTVDIEGALQAATRFDQSFSLQWKLTGTRTPIPRSGHPGYRNGFPVLAGLTVSSARLGVTAVMTLPKGFDLPLGGPCSPQFARTKEVLFLHGVLTSGCHLDLTSDELRGICLNESVSVPVLVDSSASGIATPPDVQRNGLLLPNALRAAFAPRATASSPLTSVSPSFLLADMLGGFGDSDPANIHDWVPIVTDPVDVTPASKMELNGCTGLVTGVTLDVFVARFGSKTNPQDRIVGVRRRWTTGNWTYDGAQVRADSSGVPKQRFWITNSVRFIRHAFGGSTTEIVNPPPLLPALPADVFYPFSLSARPKPSGSDGLRSATAALEYYDPADLKQEVLGRTADYE